MKNVTFLFMFILLCTLIPEMVSSFDVDTDGDNVLDSADICPETPDGSVIVDPILNYKYAGCTCEQIESMPTLGFTTLDDECIHFQCTGEFFVLEPINYEGPIVQCPPVEFDTVCVGTSLYTYPSSGYHTCVRGTLVEFTCDPVIEERSTACQGENAVIENKVLMTEEGTGIPVLTGELTTYSDDYSTTIKISQTSQLETGGTALIDILFLWGASQQGVREITNLQLSFEGQNLVPQNSSAGESLDDTQRWVWARWYLIPQTTGTVPYTIDYAYTTDLGVTQETLSGEFLVTSVLESEETIITSSQSDYLNILCAEFLPNCDNEVFLSEVKQAEENIYVEKSSDSGDGTTSYKIKIIPRKGALRDVTIIENIPKEIASSVDEITFSIPPTEVLLDDPLIMWHFDEIDGQKELTYDVDREIEVTGNTVITVGEVVESSLLLHIIIPIIAAVLVVAGIIFMPQLRKKVE